MHPQPSFLPISDHNIVFVPVKLLGYSAQNRRLRALAKPPVDRKRLVTDPQLRQEVATAVGRHLRANPPGDSNVDDVEAAFAAAIMRTAELVIPHQEGRRPERGWSGDARTEVELQAASDAMHTAWQRLKMDTRDAQLRRAVRKACNSLKRVRSAAVVRSFERHVVGLEKQLRMGDQHGFFQNIKLVQLEETKKVESQCVRDEEGRLLRDKGRIRERWVRFFRSLLNSISNILDLDIPKRLQQHPIASALGIEPTKEETATAMEAVEMVPNRVIGEVVLDGDGHFIPAGIDGFHTLSLLLASLVAHDRAKEDTHTHTGKEHKYTRRSKHTTWIHYIILDREVLTPSPCE